METVDVVEQAIAERVEDKKTHLIVLTFHFLNTPLYLLHQLYEQSVCLRTLIDSQRGYEALI